MNTHTHTHHRGTEKDKKKFLHQCNFERPHLGHCWRPGPSCPILPFPIEVLAVNVFCMALEMELRGVHVAGRHNGHNGHNRHHELRF